MTNQAAREVFNHIISKQADADQVAKLELAREYFTNGAFRKALENHLWEARK
jgi:hypothetical protein